MRPALAFPKIPIGKIERVIFNKDLLTLSVDVRLYSDVDDLTLVFVVGNFKEK